MNRDPGALSPEEPRRYARHLSLAEVGEAGQRRLKAARVLLVGAGGLGSPFALYLAAAGVGTLGVVDFDDVDESNLQRQVVHGTGALGRPKLDSLVARLRDLDPHVRVEPYPFRLDRTNALGLVRRYDVVADGTDNFATRYLVNDASAGPWVPVRGGRPRSATARRAAALGAATLHGDAANPAILARAGLERARVLVVAIGDPLTARLAIERATAINPRLDISSRARGRDDVERLRSAGVTRMADPEVEAGLELARHALQRMGVSGPELQAILVRLRRDAYGRRGDLRRAAAGSRGSHSIRRR